MRRDALVAALPGAVIEPFGAALHVRPAEPDVGVASLRRALADRGLGAASVVETEPTLEDVFLRVVGSPGA
ncbi:MAG TPA: hypothetical protein VHB21_20215 [Minicystis sp.]|nr:hypothetical protein [Minicystis sp.]